MFYETVTALNGNNVTRLKSSLFYWAGLGCLLVGGFFLSEKLSIGAGLIIFMSPCLFLYPPVRFLVGGKDSVGAVIATVVVEEVLKNEIKKSTRKKNRK